jgi:7-carboxy-7-deazaguanine synthase
MTTTLAVNEIFGPTFQGEGLHLGKPCLFLRLAGCNLSCQWCDTPYTWDWTRHDKAKEVKRLTIAEVVDRLQALSQGVRRLVISGGEPMLQQKNLYALVNKLRQDGWTTEMETAGTISPDTLVLVDHFTVSPKLANSGDSLKRRYHPEVLERLNAAPSRSFKFVVQTENDFDEIDQMVRRHDLSPVMIMPEGIDGTVISNRLKELATATLKRRYALTTRLQVMLYGNQRAV